MQTRYISRAISFTALLLIISASLLFSVCAADVTVTECDIVGSDNSRMILSADVSNELVDSAKDKKLCVFEFSPANDTSDISSLEPIFELDIARSVSKSFDRKRSALYSSYVFAIREEDGSYTIVSDRAYVRNPEKLAENTLPYPTRTTKKGLCSQITSDAQYLGVEHTTISIDIGDYMASSQGSDTIAVTRYGQTFYFYDDMLSALDHKVKVLTEAGMNVYFNIVLGKNETHELDHMYFDGASESASLYAINTSTLTSSRYFTVFCEYLAERYSSSQNGEHGFVPAYILGYEVDSKGIWNSAGDIGADEYVTRYENAYRILYNAVKSTYKNARVFVSVSNIFSATQSADDLGAKAFLSAFAENIRRGGDIPWALAINPYASDPANTEFWNDEKATDSLDTPYITMKNLSVLSEFMRLENMTYRDDVRDMIVGEFGINGNYTDAKNNDCQAAAYALAYAIADTNEDIDAFIYYRHVDHPAESAHYGLWTSNTASPLTPENKKSIYNIFKNVDTAEYASGLEMARAFIGDELYQKYIDSYAPSAKKHIFSSIPVVKSDIRAIFKERTLFDLTLGELYDFYPSDNSSYVELRPTSEDSLSTELYSLQRPASGQTYSGISTPMYDKDLTKAQYLTFSFMPTTPSTQTVTVMLRLDTQSEHESFSYEGIVQLTPNTKSELSFDISDFIKATDGKVDTLKLWYKPSSGMLETGEYGMWLEKITVHERTGLSALVTVLIHVFGTALILAIVAAIVILNKNKAVKNKLKGVLGKTRSKIIGFLKDKKIISRRHKKKKGARYTPPKQTIVEKTVRDKEPTVRIVNGRVLPRVPAHPQTQTQTQKNTSSAEKKRENREKDDE